MKKSLNIEMIVKKKEIIVNRTITGFTNFELLGFLTVWVKELKEKIVKEVANGETKT